jgi:hypothetical protein
MAINYTVLKSSIIFSTIWQEDSDTRVVWITLLAMRNKDGEVFASIPGLAGVSRVDLAKTAAALEKFLAPEAYSSSGDDGRRLEVIPGGWRLLNHEKVKAEAAQAAKNAYMAGFMRKKRKDKKKAGPHIPTGPSPGEPLNP